MRVSFIDRLKIISQTLMFVVIVAFVSACYYLYEKQNVVMAEETRWTLPDFEHTNNQQFLYIYSSLCKCFLRDRQNIHARGIFSSWR